MMNLEQCEIKQLKQEVAGLRAHVHRLKEDIAWLSKKYGFEYSFDELDSLDQSLQQIKRDAVLEIASNIRTFETVYNDEICVALRLSDLESRANNLVKDGE